MTEHAAIKRYGPIAVIAAAAVLGAWLLSDLLSFEALRDNRETLLGYRDQHYALAVAVFVAAYVVIVAFSLPGAVIATLTGGFLFGLSVGATLNIVGATVGAVLIFLAARHGFGDALKRRMEASDGMMARLARGLEENQWSMLFFIRLVPVVPFFVANLLPAFLNVPLWRFVVSTFLGIIPGGLVYTSVGVGLGEVFARGETPNLGIIFEPYVLGPILGLCALSVLPMVLKAVRSKRVEQD